MFCFARSPYRIVCIPSINALCLLFVLSFTAFAPTYAQRLTWLGTLGGTESQAEAVSGNGSVVVGWSKNTVGQNRAFRWTVTTGMRDLGTIGGEWSIAYDISANGSVIVGTSAVPDSERGWWGRETFRGFAWENGVMQDLGAEVILDPWHWIYVYGSTEAYGVSSTGRTIVGYEEVPSDMPFPPWYAVRWVNGTRERIQLNGVANDVSADGNVIVGHLNTAFGRYPYVWTNGVGNFLGDRDFEGRQVYDWHPWREVNTAYAVSADGRIAVGKGYRDGRYSRAIRWFLTYGTCEDLGTLGGNQACALDVSANGAVVVGWAENNRGQMRAFRWNGGIMVDLNLLCEHILYPGSYLKVATGISPDGRYIVGQGYNAETRRFEAFLLDVRGLSAPLRPTDLQAFPISSQKIELTWKDNSLSERGFRIERIQEDTGAAHFITVGANVTRYVDEGLEPETTYKYRVYAYNLIATSPPSEEAVATTCSGIGMRAALGVCLRANLHSHSTFSDGLSSPSGVFTWAADNGWNVWALTDHAEQITNDEWQQTLEEANAASALYGNDFVALRGFEWTAFTPNSADPDDQIGHMNVLGSVTRKGAYKTSEIADEDVIRGLRQFYEWLANPETRAIDGGLVVAQYNHPTTYDDSSHFDDMRLPFSLVPFSASQTMQQQLLQVVALMELGSHFFRLLQLEYEYEGGLDNLTGNPMKSNELWFQLALANGWHVAPANNGDTHMYWPSVFPPLRMYTGIWAGQLDGTAEDRTARVLHALRKRRVFSSEDLSADLSFQVKLSRGTRQQDEFYWMGASFFMPSTADGMILDIYIRKNGANDDDYVYSVEVIAGNRLLRVFPQNPEQSPHPYRSRSIITTASLPSAFISRRELERIPRTAMGEIYLYVRVRTSRGNLLYSAPIWVRGIGSYYLILPPDLWYVAHLNRERWK